MKRNFLSTFFLAVTVFAFLQGCSERTLDSAADDINRSARKVDRAVGNAVD